MMELPGTTWAVDLETLTRGTGLTGSNYDGLTGTTFAVDFPASGVGNNGSSDQAARYDHEHSPGEVNLATLTRGNGLSGLDYDGTTGTTWAVDLETLTRGTGLTGSNYDGLTGTTFAVDFPASGVGNNGSSNQAARYDHTHPNLLGDGTDYQTIFWDPTGDGAWTPSSYLTNDQSQVTIGGDGLGNGILELFNDQVGTDRALIFQPNPAMTETTTYRFPPADGNNTQALLTDGSGNLYWGTAGDDGDWIVNGTDMYSNTSITNVGIGTETPNASAMLDVNGTGSYTGDIISRDGSLAILNTNTAGSLIFQEPDTEGQDEISFTAPAISGNINYTLPSDYGSDAQVLTTNASGELYWSDGPKAWMLEGNSDTDPSINYIGTTNDVDLVFKTNDDERMRILKGGMVGIGTSVPGVLLDVNGAASFSDDVTVTDGNIAITNTNNTAGTLSFYEASGSGSNYTSFSSTVQSEDIHYVWPAEQAQSSTVSVLVNDGTGTLEWDDLSLLSGYNRYNLYVNPTGDTDYTASIEDVIIIFQELDDVTLNLPDATSNMDGKIYYVRWAITGGTDYECTIDPYGSQEIDGQTSKTYGGNSEKTRGLLIVCDGSEWYVISGYYEN
jgi:hypothetical protein